MTIKSYQVALALLVSFVNVVFAEEVFCTRGDYPSGHWEPTKEVSVPTVPFNWKELHPPAPEVFFSKKGYTFCGNGQGDRETDVPLYIHQPPHLLKSRWVPGTDGGGCVYQDFNRSSAQHCLKDTWLHLEGDSLMRDTYYDVLEVTGVTRYHVCRSKVHTDLVTDGSFRLLTRDGSALTRVQARLKVSMAFNPAMHPACPPLESWMRPDIVMRNHTRVPDFWVFSPGLWFFHEGDPDSKEEFTRRLTCVGEAGRRHPGVQTLLRLRTHYADPPGVNNSRHDEGWAEWLNSECIRVLHHQFGWRVLDAYSLTRQAPQLSRDTVHYTGKGSRTMTNVMLNILCNRQ
jgi:hypothetical protein